MCSELLFGDYLDKGLLSPHLNKEACYPFDASRHLMTVRDFYLKIKPTWQNTELRDFRETEREL